MPSSTIGSDQVRLLFLTISKSKAVQESQWIPIHSGYRSGYTYICGTTGHIIVSYGIVNVWFRKFKNGDVCLEDQPRSGRPAAVNKTKAI